MHATRWDPFTALARADREFDDLVLRAWGPSQRPAGAAAAPAPRAGTVRRLSAGYVPAVEMFAEGHDVVLRLELPGVDVENDVSIEVDRGRLVIAGERRDTRSRDSGASLVRELRYGSFRREFALPEGIDAGQVEASYDAGMLEVRVYEVVRPEPEPVKVPIKAGTAQEVSAADARSAD
ncbi:MAG: Hsp20/alpha crystallin family protein [Actinomycetota bacterium]|nr:Hsp20/alpha crystallin family protein [Actinomycetota bacterium]